MPHGAGRSGLWRTAGHGRWLCIHSCGSVAGASPSPRWARAILAERALCLGLPSEFGSWRGRATAGGSRPIDCWSTVLGIWLVLLVCYFLNALPSCTSRFAVALARIDITQECITHSSKRGLPMPLEGIGWFEQASIVRVGASRSDQRGVGVRLPWPLPRPLFEDGTTDGSVVLAVSFEWATLPLGLSVGRRLLPHPSPRPLFHNRRF